MEFLDKVLSFLVSAQGSAVTIAVVLEFIFRLVPSEKPLSLLHVIGYSAKKVGAIFVALGDLLDKVLPQSVVRPSV